MWHKRATKGKISSVPQDQEVRAPKGLNMHGASLTEGRRNNWTFSVQRELYRQLSSVLDVEENQYCLYADSGYSVPIHLEVLFQGDNIPDVQRLHNTATSSGRVRVEFISKEIKLFWTTVDTK